MGYIVAVNGITLALGYIVAVNGITLALGYIIVAMNGITATSTCTLSGPIRKVYNTLTY